MGIFNKIYSTEPFENFWKIYLQFAQKFKTIIQNCSGIKFNKILKHLRNFQIFSKSVEHLQ